MEWCAIHRSLTLYAPKKIKILTFHEVLHSLCNDPILTHKGGAGTDITDLLAYYIKHRQTPI